MTIKTKKILIWTAVIIIAAGWTYLLDLLSPGTLVQTFLFSITICTPATIAIVMCLRQIKWRHDNGVDLFATLETDEEKLKEHMLFIMQYHGIEENLKELNTIFRNYPQWNLHNWVVFRAWYKCQVDQMLKHPEIYVLTMKSDGSTYRKEKDSLYDPSAPDWAMFDRDRSDNYDDDDFEDYHQNDHRSSDCDVNAIGIGFCTANCMSGDSLFGGDCGGN